MQDLRDHLFAALESLSDEEKPMEIERARAICAVAREVIDSARVEVKYLEVTGVGIEAEKRAQKFFGEESRPALPIASNARKNLPA